MRQVWLVALGQMWEQRIVLFVMGGWVIVFGLLFGLLKNAHADDATFLLRQQAIYAPIYAMFLGAAAVHGERKSRRILSVLSKGVSRTQYLVGLTLGCVLIIALYLLCAGVSTLLMFMRFHVVAHIWLTLAAVLVASVAAAGMGVFFGSLLHPMFAATVSAALLASPYLLAARYGPAWHHILPVAWVIERVLRSDPRTGWSAGWEFAIPCGFITALTLMGGGLIFERRDIAVPVE